MAVANFEELAKWFCEIAGTSPPALTSGDDRALAFTVRLRGVPVSLLEMGDASAGCAYLMAEFGAMPRPMELEGWQVLLERNLRMLGARCAPFSRNPQTGNIVLQRAVPLAQTTGTDVYLEVSWMVDLALQWRRDCLHDRPLRTPWSELDAAAPPCSPGMPSIAGSCLRDLHAAVCDALREPGTGLRSSAGVWGFDIRVEGVPARVLHLPASDPHHVFVVLALGSSCALDEARVLRCLMEANFALMTHGHGMAHSRDPVTGGLLMHYAHTLGSANAHDFLGRLKRMARFSAQWSHAVNTPA